MSRVQIIRRNLLRQLSGYERAMSEVDSYRELWPKHELAVKLFLRKATCLLHADSFSQTLRPPVVDCLFPVRARVPQNLPRPTVDIFVRMRKSTAT